MKQQQVTEAKSMGWSQPARSCYSVSLDMSLNFSSLPHRIGMSLMTTRSILYNGWAKYLVFIVNINKATISLSGLFIIFSFSSI